MLSRKLRRWWPRRAPARVPVEVTDLTAGQPFRTDSPTLIPLVSLYEGDTDLLVSADVPGASPALTRVQVDGERLILTAATGDGAAAGRWRRELRLPCRVRASDGWAALDGGVLTVSLPKRDVRRRIPVAAA